MCFSILKLSYKHPGEEAIEGGICGTGFFINGKTGITANHVLNINTLAPNSGCNFVRLWILTRSNEIFPINESMIQFFPEIDTSIITVAESTIPSIVYNCSSSIIEKDLSIAAYGHIGSHMPKLDAKWESDELIISGCNLNSVSCDTSGKVKELKIMTINATDVNMNNIRGFEVSFSSRVGMSGGPVITKSNNEVIGMLSFGLPSDSEIKTSTFAVSIDEIVDRIQ